MTEHDPADPDPGRGVITRVALPVTDDDDRLVVSVGSTVVARLRARDVETLDVAVGRPWTTALAEETRTAEAVETSRRAALRMLGRRARSTAELEERLRARGVDAEVARRAVETLVTEGWVDDDALAKQLAEEHMTRTPATAEVITRRLEARRIPTEVAESAAAHSVEGVDTQELALAIARKRLATGGDLPPHRAARRVAGVLSRRGFDEDTVRLVLHRLSLPWE